MNCVTLKNIELTCDASRGGIKRAYIARYEDILSVTYNYASDDTDHKNPLEIASITMKGDAKFLEFSFRKSTGSLSSTLNLDDANGINYVQNDIVLVFSRMETAKRNAVRALSLGELCVLILDNNGKLWMCGGPDEEPVTASAGSGTTGTAVGDGNNYSVTLTNTADSYPYEVNMTAEALGDIIDYNN